MRRLLVLGGTLFAGREIAAAAQRDGWKVTTFNRGRSGVDLPGVEIVRGDRMSSSDLERLRDLGSWDAAVDTSGYVPSNVLAVARTLRPAVGHYVFMSTVSVYADWPVLPLTESSVVLQAPPDAGPDFGQDVEDGPTKYGYQKAGCEAAARAVFEDACTLLRPGVVLGPHEYVGRLPWWLRRVSAGGRIVAPGRPERTIQPVDVRDLAEFAVLCAERQIASSFNVTAPIGRETFGGFLQACSEATRSDPEFVWVPDDVLLNLGVRQWSEMPLWRTFSGVWRVDSTMAHTAGLQCRPLGDTVRDTWEWLASSGVSSSFGERQMEIGLSAEKEREVLGAVG